MPPKKRKPKKQPTQKQSQRQSVVVNIGSARKPRKASGKGSLPPPSYAHNLAPTFVTAPQVDYTPLLAMMQHNASRLVAQAPVAATQTPLSSTLIASNAEQMAGEAAIRRSGPTAVNFQPLPSQADERLAVPSPSPSKSRTRATKAQITERRAMGAEDKPIVSPKKKRQTQEVRPPDEPYMKRLQDDPSPPPPRGRTLMKKKVISARSRSSQ
mgnify:FL=1|tara:strand:- start:1642 stop:2277 length:636 start_codon:yes stop_codon:yes gene_type:complete